METNDPGDPYVAILTPIGRDAVASAEVLRRAGYESTICANTAELVASLNSGASVALVTEEALFGRPSDEVGCWIESQEPWSDMPFVILTSRLERPEVLIWRQRLLVRFRNVSLLERPLDAITLASAISSAIRGRLRQYQVRDYVSARASAAAQLEEIVAERTKELRVQISKRAEVEAVLRQSQKMEAVGQLTGGIAHDFNNLLMSITGSLDILGERLARGNVSDLERYIVAAQGASRRAAALTHRLLAFSRRQTLDPKPTDVNRLIADMEDLVRRTVGPSIDVKVQLADDVWPTLVDQNQLENALLNLCINARDAMPDGGQLLINTNNELINSEVAQESDILPGQYVALRVRDTGNGMEPSVLAHAFDPFFTTKPLGQGTGLGLSMIYGFVRQSGGHVSITSEPLKGTNVCVFFPRQYAQIEMPEETQEVTPSDTVAERGEGETVLVVDDESSIRMIVTDVLEEAGYTPIEAEDGRSGLQILQSNTRIDLLITDVGLPGGMNGRQLADAGRASRPDMKVLFITGYADNAVIRGGDLEAGMHVLTKPFAIDELVHRIKTLVNSGPA